MGLEQIEESTAPELLLAESSCLYIPRDKGSKGNESGEELMKYDILNQCSQVQHQPKLDLLPNQHSNG
jgi:hypothetical protein